MEKYLKIGKFHVATEILHKAIHEENKEFLKQLKTLFSESDIENINKAKKFLKENGYVEEDCY